METCEYGLQLKIEGIGYFEKRFRKSLHEVKSKAGKAFHSPFVISVCVYDYKGNPRLYLKKTEKGVVREERDESGNLIE